MKRLDQLSYMELKPLLEQIRCFAENIRQKHGVDLGFIYYDRTRNDNDVSHTTQYVAEVLYHCVETQLGITKNAFVSKSRTNEEVQARQFFVAGMKLRTSASLKKIGECIGGRDHAAVINLADGFNDNYDTQPAYRNKWANFYAVVQGQLKKLTETETMHVVRRVELEGEILQLAERLLNVGLSADECNAIIKTKMELNAELEQLTINKT